MKASVSLERSHMCLGRELVDGKDTVHRSWLRVFSLADKVLLLPTRGVVPSEVDLLVDEHGRWPPQVVERGRKEPRWW